jgi:hypothetical protein
MVGPDSYGPDNRWLAIAREDLGEESTSAPCADFIRRPADLVVRLPAVSAYVVQPCALQCAYLRSGPAETGRWR